MKTQLAVAGVWVLSALVMSAHPAFATTTYEKEMIARGAAFGSIDGIECDQDNHLWVAVASSSTVYKLTKNGSVIETYGPDQGVSFPVDVTVGSDGRASFVEFFSGHVKHIAADGAITVLGTVSVGADALAFNREGRLFVSAFAPGVYDQIWEVDPHGAHPPVVKVTNPGMLNTFAFGPDNLLYGPQTFGDAVVRVNVDSSHMLTVASGFVAPIVAKSDREDRLVVVDEGARTLYGVNAQTGQKTVVGDAIPPGTDALTFDRRNRLYIGSAITGFLGCMEDQSTLVSLAKTGMVLPGGVAVTPSEQGRDQVWVADFFSVRTFRGSSGRESAVFPGNSPPQLFEPFGVGFPTGISTGPNGTLILSSFFLGQVRTWHPRTDAATIYAPFSAPMAAVAFQGDIAVAELGTGQVVRASDHAVIANNLILPTGLAAADHRLWVAEFAPGTIKQIMHHGAMLSPPVVEASGLAGPEGIAMDATGTGILVVEATARQVSHIDLATGNKTVLATGLQLGATATAGLPPTGATLSGIAVGNHGALYVTGDARRVLYRLTPTDQHVLP